MRFTTGQYFINREKRRGTWRKWFAWYPVWIYEEDGILQWVWLEYLERKINDVHSSELYWIYREVRNDTG